MFQREADLARAELNTLMGRQPDQPLDKADLKFMPALRVM
jgi:hypothetical protein